jgi:hypothetical protein
MSRPSSIDKLPAEIRETIGKLRMGGCTIDQILAHLKTLLPETPSRSALGRHMLRMDALGQKMRRSREVAEALAGSLGDKPGSELAKMNIELLHGAVMQLFLDSAEDAEDADIAEGGALALRGDPEGLMMLSKSIQSLVQASKNNADYIVAAETRATKKAQQAASAAVDVVAKSRGLSSEIAEAIKSKIFGVAPA